MTTILQSLIRDASTQLGSEACRNGKHIWASDGGSACPLGSESCSQTVYRCRVCDDYDYGEPGGPGHTDCANNTDCEFRWTTSTNHGPVHSVTKIHQTDPGPPLTPET